MFADDIKVSIINYFQLRVEVKCDNKELSFAFYLYKGNEILEKTSYQKEGVHTFHLEEPGNYFVRVYAKDKSGSRLAENSERIKFTGFRESPRSQKDSVFIYGVSKMSAAVKMILQKNHEIKGFVSNDEEKVDDLFFGQPILHINKLYEMDNFSLVVVDSFFEDNKNQRLFDGWDVDFFQSNFLGDDLVTKTLNALSLFQLYQLSRECYLNGLLKGAKFIQSFSQFKYNSVVPYTVEMGENVSFGYGGIGMVINGKSIIGNNVKISQNVTIGSKGERPVIGNNVWIGPGSKLLGGKIGDNVIIGANSVVTKEIPNGCVVAGVPAKVISEDIDKYSSYFNNI